MKGKKALITGVTGQDGSYLVELLLEKNYEIHGIKRRSSSLNTQRVDHLYQDPHENNPRFFMHYGDLTDSTNLIRLIKEIEPDEIYNLGAQSHVAVSFETPEYTANCDALGTLRILEAVRILGLKNKTKIYQASTSELYGKIYESPQTLTYEASIQTNFFKDHYLTMSNIDRSEYYNIKFQEKPLMIWIWISTIMLSFGGFLSLFRNAKNN